jgi:hypothetical protein
LLPNVILDLVDKLEPIPRASISEAALFTIADPAMEIPLPTREMDLRLTEEPIANKPKIDNRLPPIALDRSERVLPILEESMTESR